MNTSADRDRSEERAQMVATQIENRGIHDAAVLAALRAVPRHRFVPANHLKQAYADMPLPIGQDQTISQPYIGACMTDLLRISNKPNARVLEIGTGCGYQTAILALLAREVYSIEILPRLARLAAKRLNGLRSIHLRAGDGFAGWPEQAPFDGILVAAAPPSIPPPLLEQLTVGGRLVIPVGRDRQELLVIRRTPTGLERETILPVRFVPMTGRALTE